MPKRGSSTSKDDHSESEWMYLIRVGNQMTQLGALLVTLGNQQSKPQLQDVVEMMKACSEMMHIGSQYLFETPTASAIASATSGGMWQTLNSNKQAQSVTTHPSLVHPPIIRRQFSQPTRHRSSKQKRRLSLPPHSKVPNQAAPPSHTAFSQIGDIPAVTPASSAADAPDERTHPVYFLPVGEDKVDTAMWNNFSELFGNTQNRDTDTTSFADHGDTDRAKAFGYKESHG